MLVYTPRLANGNKAIPLLLGTLWNLVAQAVTAWAVLKGWAPEKEQAVITLVGVVAGLSGQLLGIAQAGIMAWDDYLITVTHAASIKAAPGDQQNPNPTGGV